MAENVEPQYVFDIESNILWIDTLYWRIISDLKKMEVNHRIYSRHMKLSYLPGRFYLSFGKISPSQFLLELVRDINEEESEKGYELQVSFSIVSSPGIRKITYMDYGIINAPVYFNFDDFFTKYCLTDKWIIKCVVWMREYLTSNNDRRHEQGQLWKKKLSGIFPDHQQYEQMTFIMGRKSFSGLFTGRQDYKFADFKSTLLLRSFRYSDKLLAKISRRWQGELSTEESIEDLGRQLGYIKNGQESCIENKDCILLYISAFYYGLSYLKMQCSDYMKMNLNLGDINFFIDVMTISDLVNDKDLMNYASDWFLKNYKRVLDSVEWNNFKKLNYDLSTAFTISIIRFQQHHQENVEHLSSLRRMEDKA